MRRIAEAIIVGTKALHWVSGAFIVGLMFMTVANILGRWTMGRPVRGTVELTEIGMIAIVFLGLAYAQVRDDHIRVDLLYNRLGERGRLVLRAFSSIVSLAVVLVMTWRLYDYSGVLASSGRTTSSLAIPLTWAAWIAVAGGIVYAIGILSTMTDRSGPPPPATKPTSELDARRAREDSSGSER